MNNPTLRHSPYCPKEGRGEEAVCQCGHPRCLHKAIMGSGPGAYLATGLYVPCRSLECSPAVNQECDAYIAEEGDADDEE